MSSPRSYIHIYGTVCVDRVRKISTLPSRGGYVDIEDERAMLGGEAANTAVVLAQWMGASSSDVSLVLNGNHVGKDANGDLVMNLLNKIKTPRTNIAVQQCDDVATPVCDIYVTPDGERTMFGLGFMNVKPFTYKDHLRSGGWFTVDQNQGKEGRAAVLEAARVGMTVYLMDFWRESLDDADPIPPGAILQVSTDWVGAKGDINANMSWASAWLSRHGTVPPLHKDHDDDGKNNVAGTNTFHFVIVTDGDRGFVCGGYWPTPSGGSAYTWMDMRHFPAFPIPLMVDSTGAGDTFRAGVLYGLAQCWSFHDTLSWASAAGALACTRPGGSASAPAHAEVADFVSRNTQHTPP
eukprot:TRINITY_DN11432_c0_g1_i1.p1 TRINITY_DN11432_c0_g1~~TRINITY_DN11432_c0_g1_i1.p1  ORF type:complete len:351 (+),score=41.67 TRINITY_DN11432_c0_g1_i1:2-1054(+)